MPRKGTLTAKFNALEGGFGAVEAHLFRIGGWLGRLGGRLDAMARLLAEGGRTPGDHARDCLMGR